jgi:hypothetical protein
MTTMRQATPAAVQTDATVRIEHNRRRLFLRLLAGAVALASIGVGLTVMVLHVAQQPTRVTGVADLDVFLSHRSYGAPWWAPIAFGFAAAGACIGLLRTFFRLQDADPALVVSPRGMRFRPTLFAEQVTIPWTVVRRLKLRQYKQHSYMLVRVDEIDRHVPRVGSRGWLRRLFRPGARDGDVAVDVVLSKAEWKRTEALLRAYLAKYGKPDTQAAASSAS